MFPFLERLYSSMSPYTSCRIFSTDGTRDPGMSLHTAVLESFGWTAWTEYGALMVIQCIIVRDAKRIYANQFSSRIPNSQSETQIKRLFSTPLLSDYLLPPFTVVKMDHFRPPPRASPPDTHCSVTFAEIMTSGDINNTAATSSGTTTTCATEGNGDGGGGHRGENDGDFDEEDGDGATPTDDGEGGRKRRSRRWFHAERAGSLSNLPP